MNRRLIFITGALLAASAVPVSAQQFVDEMASRLLAPAPTDYSNQLTIGGLDGDDDLDLIIANGGGFAS